MIQIAALLFHSLLSTIIFQTQWTTVQKWTWILTNLFQNPSITYQVLLNYIFLTLALSWIEIGFFSISNLEHLLVNLVLFELMSIIVRIRNFRTRILIPFFLNIQIRLILFGLDFLWSLNIIDSYPIAPSVWELLALIDHSFQKYTLFNVTVCFMVLIRYRWFCVCFVSASDQVIPNVEFKLELFV